MNFHGYIADRFLSEIDSFSPEDQDRVLYDLPDGRHVAPEVKHRMRYKDERASEALNHVRRLLPMPFSPNTLSPKLYREPSLIDHERWDEARDKARAELQSRGAYLPCDYMFGDRPRMVMVKSFNSDETIRPAGVNRCGCLDSAKRAGEDTSLLRPEQSQIGDTEQSRGTETWQLLSDFGRATGKLLVKLLTCR